MTRLVCFLLFISPVLTSQAQEIRKLPATVNRVNTVNKLPRLSGDGITMIYVSNLAHAEGFKVWEIKRIGNGWSVPDFFDPIIVGNNVNTEAGYFISYDGQTIVFTSRRYGSMGGYDIWIAEKEGNSWGAPRNAGKPLNSSAHEGDPSISADGQFLYFTRCKSMSEKAADGCQVMVARKKANGYFYEPKVLPESVNTGNETAPLILVDNQTLYFASKRPDGKGGWDLYMSRRLGDDWSKAVPLDFLNTEKDDRYLSVPASGRLAFFSRAVEGDLESIYQAVIPEELRQLPILWLDGLVTFDDESKQGLLHVNNLTTGEGLVRPTDEDGSFFQILTAGSAYDLAVTDQSGKFTFESRLYDLLETEESKRTLLKVDLKPLDQTLFYLTNVVFEEFTSTLGLSSQKELNRVVFLAKQNPGLKAEISVFQKHYLEDSVQSHPDLTEVIVDTLFFTEIIEKVDSFMIEQPDSIHLVNIRDSVLVSDVPDSIEQQVEYKHVVTYDTLTRTELQFTYHNNRTEKQAQAIYHYLSEKGIGEERIKVEGKGQVSEPHDDKYYTRGILVAIRFY